LQFNLVIVRDEPVGLYVYEAGEVVSWR